MSEEIYYVAGNHVVCKVCNIPFKQLSNLKIHYENKHLDSGGNLIAPKPHEVSEKVPDITPDNSIKCPRCKSTQITSNKKGYGVGKAAVGAVLTGGIGLLGGFIGSGKIKLTCLKCGKSWKPGKH